MELRAPARSARHEPKPRIADQHARTVDAEIENLRQRFGLRLRVVRAQVELAEPQLVLRLQQLVEPLARRMELEPVARVGRDERPSAAVILDAQPKRGRAQERVLEGIGIERDPDVVYTRQLPLSRLHDDVHRAVLQLAQPQAEPLPVELVPCDTGAKDLRVFGYAPIPRDEMEAELPDVPRLDLPHLARHEVVVEQVHGRSILDSVFVDELLRLAPVVVAAAMILVRARTLRRRGTPVPSWRLALVFGGLAVLVVALLPPLHELADERMFSAHMLQHVLLGDIAALMILVGVTGPLLRPVLALPWAARLRALTHPAVALPIWALNLFAWHAPVLYEAALRSDAVHALQHMLFFGCGVLMWAPVIETLPAPVWFGTAVKLGYIVVVRLLETVLGNVLFWAGEPLYDVYARAKPLWGLSPLADQGIAGGVMMIEGSLVTIGALAWLFLRLAREGELRQQLLEEGLDPRAVQRAVRYGRADELR